MTRSTHLVDAVAGLTTTSRSTGTAIALFSPSQRRMRRHHHYRHPRCCPHRHSRPHRHQHYTALTTTPSHSLPPSLPPPSLPPSPATCNTTATVTFVITEPSSRRPRCYHHRRRPHPCHDHHWHTDYHCLHPHCLTIIVTPTALCRLHATYTDLTATTDAAVHHSWWLHGLGS